MQDISQRHRCKKLTRYQYKEIMEPGQEHYFEELLQIQRKYFLSQATLPMTFRKEQLLKLRDTLKNHEEELCYALMKDFHKSTFDTFTTELGMIYSEITWQLRHLRCNMRAEHIRCNLLNLPSRFQLLNEPLGNVLIIGAWNYPLHLSLLPAVDAMAAGCTCIVKPSELPHNTAEVLRHIINEHFNKEYLHIVTGGIEETTMLLKLQFDKIFFTGSPQVGKIVYQAAAQNLVPVTLELGGKSPVIVTRHADLATAAKRIAWGKCLNAGQTCVAPDFLLAEKCVKDSLLSLLKEELTAAHYRQNSDSITSIINRKHYDRLMELMKPYQNANNQIICGGQGNEDNLYIEPTLIDNVHWDEPIMQQEIFGPLLPIITFDDFKDTLQHLALQDHPLSAYLFSNDKTEQKLFGQTLSFGGGCINDVMMHLTNPNTPFGGVGNSGIGNYHGKHGFLCFTHQKSLLRKPVHGEPSLKYPPYNDKKLSLAKKVM